MGSVVVVAALDGVHGGVGGVHPGSSTVGAQRQPGDDAGLQTFHSGKKLVCLCKSVNMCVGQVLPLLQILCN